MRPRGGVAGSLLLFSFSSFALSCAVVSCGGSDDVRIEALGGLPEDEPAGASAPSRGGATLADSGARRDAGAPRHGGSEPTGDGGTADAGPAPCPPLGDTPKSGARWAVAVRSTKAKALDGDFSDYAGCVSVLLDATTAARVKGKPEASAKIFVEWEPAALWIAAEISDAKLEGSHPFLPYMNDSFEVYVSSAGLRTGDYGPHDHQFIIDHKGLSLYYPRYPRNGLPVPNPNARAYATAGGWRVEMRIDAVSAFGAPLAQGDVRFLDVMLTDSVRQKAFLIWAMQPHATCTCDRCDCNRSPAYDTLLFAPMTLQ